MTPIDQQFMSRALELAENAQEQGEVPVGAVLVLNDQIIAEAYNQPITKNDPTAHAEILALRSAAEELKNYRLIDTTLYVTLEPCAMCVGAIIHARIKRLVFAATDPKTGAVCSALPCIDSGIFNHKVQWEGGVLTAESTKLLQDFFKNRR